MTMKIRDYLKQRLDKVDKELDKYKDYPETVTFLEGKQRVYCELLQAVDRGVFEDLKVTNKVE